jgi:hypothetical protein
VSVEIYIPYPELVEIIIISLSKYELVGLLGSRLSLLNK